MTLFGLRIAIYTTDGKHHTKQSTGREFMWDFDEEARQIRDIIPGLPIPPPPLEAIIATCRALDRHTHAADGAADVRPTRLRGEQVGKAFRTVGKTQAG
jgi:hypothetical protein